MNNLRHFIDLLNYNGLAAAVGLTHVHADLLQKEVYLIGSNLLKASNPFSHFLCPLHHLTIDFGGEGVHIEAVGFIGVQLLVLEHEHVAFG